jgi:TM2 domain-containing membrane protein YozV
MQTIYCPQCGRPMSLSPEFSGTAVHCPSCRAVVFPPAVAPPQAPFAVPAPWNAMGYSQRRKLVAGLLGIFFGSLGVHRFYLGYVGIGLLQIIVTLATGGIGGIWGFIEGILCLTGNLRDVDGRPLRD